MIRRTALLGFLAISTAHALPRSAIDITAWLRANELEMDDQEISKNSAIISDEVKQQVIKRYYEPMIASIDPNRVSTGADCHWFKILDKIFFPSGPNQNFDKKVVERLRTKAAALLVGNTFKIAGLTITDPANDSKGNPFTYFVIGVATGPIIMPTAPVDAPKVDNVPKPKPRPRHRRRHDDDEEGDKEPMTDHSSAELPRTY